MGYEDEKVIVDVRDGERAQIIYKDGNGKEHTYYPSRHAYFVAEDLETLVVLSEPREGEKEPCIVRRIRGKARLEDRGLSVVGDPSSKTCTLQMTFEASDWRPKRDPITEDDLGTAWDRFVGGATLSFNRHDWEIGNDDQWWSALYLPQAFFDQLETAIAAGKVASLRVGLALRGLYSDEGDWAPVSARSNLYIRPNRKDNAINFPDLANGFVSSIAFSGPKVNMRQSPEPEPTEPLDEDKGTLPVPVDPVADAIAALGLQLEKLRVTVKWVGGLIAVFLLFLLLK